MVAVNGIVVATAAAALMLSWGLVGSSIGKGLFFSW
jgi:hypothetical protein